MTIRILANQPAVEGRLALRYAAEDDRVERVFFPDQDAAEAGLTGTATRITVGDRVYVYDAAGTEITTADGRTWRRDTGTVWTDSADTAEYWGGGATAPLTTPALFPTKLAPIAMDIATFGLKASNSLSDAADNTANIQDRINWLGNKDVDGTALSPSSGTTGVGHTIVGNGFDPRYPAPNIALAGQEVSHPDLGDIVCNIKMHPRVAMRLDRSVRFRTVEAVNTMLWAEEKLNYMTVAGGFWNTNGLADHAWWVSEVSEVHLGDKQTTLLGAKRSGLRIGNDTGDAGQAAYVSGLFIYRPADEIYTDEAVAAIEVTGDLGISDSKFTDIDTNGYPVGLYGKVFISRVENFHQWSFSERMVDGTRFDDLTATEYAFDPTTSGPCKYGFHITGGQVTFVDCQVDNPFISAFKLEGSGGYTFIAPSVTVSAASEGRGPLTNTVPMFDWSGNMRVQIFGARENDRDTTVLSGTFAPGCGLTKTTGFGWARYRGGDGSDGSGVSWHIQDGVDMTPAAVAARFQPATYVRTIAAFTPNAGTDPTIINTTNCTITRTGDADYTIVFSTSQPNNYYTPRVIVEPVVAGDTLFVTTRSWLIGSYRFQIRNAAGTLTMPAKISVIIE